MSGLNPTRTPGTYSNPSAPISNTTTLVDDGQEWLDLPGASEILSNPAHRLPFVPNRSNLTAPPADPDAITEIPFPDPPSNNSIRPSARFMDLPPNDSNPDHPIRTADATPVNSQATTISANSIPSNPLLRTWIPPVSRNIFQRMGDTIQRKKSKHMVKSKLRALLKMVFLEAEEGVAAVQLWQVVEGAETLNLRDDWVYVKLGSLLTVKVLKKQKIDWGEVETRVRLARRTRGEV